jgi:hypothetical protein
MRFQSVNEQHRQGRILKDPFSETAKDNFTQTTAAVSACDQKIGVCISSSLQYRVIRASAFGLDEERLAFQAVPLKVRDNARLVRARLFILVCCHD